MIIFSKIFILALSAMQAGGISPETIQELEELGSKCPGHADIHPIYFEPGKPEPGESLESHLHPIYGLKNLFRNLGILRCLDYSDERNVTNPLPQVGITGYADHEECEDEKSCMQLALRRANSVRDWFISRGISENAFSVPKGVFIREGEPLWMYGGASRVVYLH